MVGEKPTIASVTAGPLTTVADADAAIRGVTVSATVMVNGPCVLAVTLTVATPPTNAIGPAGETVPAASLTTTLAVPVEPGVRFPLTSLDFTEAGVATPAWNVVGAAIT